jgi:hypothetical protein
MSAPIVSWYNSTNTASVTGWDIGIVDAGGNASASTQFIIWNNRGGATSVSNMTNTTITTVATDMNSSIIADKWIQLKVGTNFEPIGGTGVNDVKSIKAVNTSVSAGIIEGGINGGTTSSDRNFCIVELRALVPSTATPGVVNFTTRVAYQYI